MRQVISFGYSVELLTPLTDDATVLDAAIQNRGDQGGSTNIAGALFAGARPTCNSKGPHAPERTPDGES